MDNLKQPSRFNLIPPTKVRGMILELLSNPQTATDLKKKMPHISSTGTIAYHLKKLVKEGIIIREEKNDVRGKPVYYYLAALKEQGFNSWEELEKAREKSKKKIELKILKELEKKELSAEEIYSRYEGTNKADDVQDILYNNAKHIEILAKITPNGEQFLKENSK